MNFNTNITNDLLEQIDNKVIPITYSELLKKDLPPRINLLDPWLPKGGLAMIYAKRGIGKTFFALELMVTIACGTNFLSFNAPRPAKVMYIDGEMPANTIKERIAQIQSRIQYPGIVIEPLIITPDLQDGFMPNLSDQIGQQQINELLDDVELVIVDNISTLCKFGKENDAESWLPVQQWILSLRKRGISVLLIHHAGKGGNQRGTSKREDILDTVINLKHPSDYKPSNGAQFEIHFEKARGMIGDDVNPTLCQLTDNGWTYTYLENSNYQKIVELANEGLRSFEIAEDLDLSKGYISKVLKKAREKGDLK